MRHIFVSPERFASNTIVLTGDEHHHLARVLRIRAGEALVVLDGLGRAGEATVEAVGAKETMLRVTGPADVAPEPAVAISVCQAIGRGDRFDDVLQHATEIGAADFVPLLTERGVVRVNSHDADAKHARWQRIVRGAAEQSHRARIPAVSALVTVAQASESIAGVALALALDPGGRDLAEVLPAPGAAEGVASPVLLFVGPEGGFSGAEISMLRDAGAEAVSLGPHILRTETAALVAISRILYHASFTAR
jgi:16S rRNA (uracil1498-N3)-methyltransferase